MFKKLACILMISSALQSCIFVAGAAIGAVAVGAVVYDKRSPQITKDDKEIVSHIKQKLNAVPEIKDQTYIVVASFNQVVLLAGEAPNEAIRSEIVAISRTTPKINKIYNEIQISGSQSTLSSTSDTWTTTKIKAQLIANKSLESGEIQVVTVNGAVYLMGDVSQSQAATAVGIVQNVSGVQKVVKLFDYHQTNEIAL